MLYLLLLIAIAALCGIRAARNARHVYTLSGRTYTPLASRPSFRRSPYEGARGYFTGAGLAAVLLTVAVLCSFLGGCVTWHPPCSPQIGDTAARVRDLCGAPAAVFLAPDDHVEWQYGRDYVGFHAGMVSYVLQ
jgi:hypothetical protein